MSKENGKCTVCDGTGRIQGLIFGADCIACRGKGTWQAQQQNSKFSAMIRILDAHLPMALIKRITSTTYFRRSFPGTT